MYENNPACKKDTKKIASMMEVSYSVLIHFVSDWKDKGVHSKGSVTCD